MRTIVVSLLDPNVTLTFNNLETDIKKILNFPQYAFKKLLNANVVIEYTEGYKLSFDLCLSQYRLDVPYVDVEQLKIHERLADETYNIIAKDKNTVDQILRIQGIEFNFEEIKHSYINKLNDIVNDIKNKLIDYYKIEHDNIFGNIASCRNIKLSLEIVNAQTETSEKTVDLYSALKYDYITKAREEFNEYNMFSNKMISLNEINICFKYSNRLYSAAIQYSDGKYKCNSFSTERDINSKVYFQTKLSSGNLSSLFKNIINKIAEYEINFYNQQKRINKDISNYVSTYNFLKEFIPEELISREKCGIEIKYPLRGQLKWIDTFHNNILINGSKHKISINDDIIIFNSLKLTTEKFKAIIKILLED